MSTKSSNTGLILAIILVIGLIVLVSRNIKSTTQDLITQQVNLQEVEQLGVKSSGTMSNMRKDIQTLQNEGKLELTISHGKLTNPILGQTKINISSEGKITCDIVLDVEDAVRAGDRVEPLLGHELKHVWDALFLYDKKDPFISVAMFIKIANDEKNKLYRDREVESSAINVEDVIRQELKASKNPAFDNMPKSRTEADVLYNRKSKLDLSLKSAM